MNPSHHTDDFGGQPDRNPFIGNTRYDPDSTPDVPHGLSLNHPKDIIPDYPDPAPAVQAAKDRCNGCGQAIDYCTCWEQSWHGSVLIGGGDGVEVVRRDEADAKLREQADMLKAEHDARIQVEDEIGKRNVQISEQAATIERLRVYLMNQCGHNKTLAAEPCGAAITLIGWSKKRMDWYQSEVTRMAKERDEAVAKAAGFDAQLHMTVARLGGMVEGHPTARLNFLQRIDALVEGEAFAEACREVSGQLDTCRDLLRRVEPMLKCARFSACYSMATEGCKCIFCNMHADIRRVLEGGKP